MARIAFSRVLFAFMFVMTASHAGPLLAASAKGQMAPVNSAPALEAVPAPAGEAPRYRIRTPPSLPAPTRNIYEILSADKDASKFMAMVDSADMKNLLVGSPEAVITVFAPTDKAMESIPADAMKRIESSKGTMQSFVEYHVIANTIVTGSALKGRKSSPASASGETLNFDGTDRTKPPKVNDGSIVGADISATNGVIHVISGAAVPPSILMIPKAAMQSAAPPKPPTLPAVPVAAKTPATPAAPVSPQVPASATAASSTTTGAKAMTVTTTGSAAFNSTATGSALNSTMTGSDIQSTTTAAAPPAQAVVQPEPSAPPQAEQPPASGETKGFTVFGHKFGW